MSIRQIPLRSTRVKTVERSMSFADAYGVAEDHGYVVTQSQLR
jgi:hypothetical protein